MTKLAIIRIRGSFHLSKEIRDTFTHLGLPKKNSCVVKEDTPSTLGMINKVKDFITWGPVSEETLKAMEKRKSKNGYALCPPKKGYGKKGIKIQYKTGGSLGDRKEKINDLLMRML